MVDEFTAECVWDVLVECCNVSDNIINRSAFVNAAIEGRWTEFRFGGSLGFGGKVWNNGCFYITCYKEDETPERIRAMEKANEELEKIFEEVYGVGSA
jgi:hypothetical protein